MRLHDKLRLPRRSVLLLVGLAFVHLSCFGQKLRGRANAVGKVIKTARKNGAYRCAPKELALAEAHLARTTDELDLGNYVPASQHIDIADKNAKLAFQKSPPEKCAPKVVIGPGDRDGDGCKDPVDKCPDKPEDKDGFQDDDCCPDLDNDQDKIVDTEDRCPNFAEDKDNFQDADGCPDNDNDRDGIVDAQDRCATEAEDHDGYQDDDGCADNDNDSDNIADLQDKCPNTPGVPEEQGCPKKYKLVVVTKKKIELKQKVYFATAKTRILPRSYQLLNEVAQVLKDRKSIHVRIEGHTDSRGSNRYNQRLSQGRANSVRAYLVQHGIDPVRMVATGYGEDRPIADNRTRTGRALNRRVEFVITKQ